MLWFCLAIVLVFALFASSGRNDSDNSRYPRRQHSIAGEIVAWAIDLFVGGPRRFRESTDIPQMQCLAGSAENMDSAGTSVNHEQGW